MTSWSIHTLFTALKGYWSTKTKKGMDQPRHHWRSTLYVISHSWVLKLFRRQFLHFFHQRESKIINLPPFCARPLIYRLNLGSKPTIKCVNHLHSSVLKTTIHTWPQVGSSWLLAPVLSSSLYHGHDIQCTSKYRTVGTSENLMGQVQCTLDLRPKSFLNRDSFLFQTRENP